MRKCTLLALIGWFFIIAYTLPVQTVGPFKDKVTCEAIRAQILAGPHIEILESSQFENLTACYEDR